jgi:hypothetical protein
MPTELEYRFVKVLLTFKGNAPRFEVFGATYASVTEVRNAIDNKLDN